MSAEMYIKQNEVSHICPQKLDVETPLLSPERYINILLCCAGICQLDIKDIGVVA